ncbi:MAG: hypothetical protein KDC12_05895 [Flavobacteriales bacterium]|nr:hypothetical protein [Flavobacteriales bacterium]
MKLLLTTLFSIAVLAIQAQDVRITKIDLEYSMVTITNIGTGMINVDTYWLCNFPVYRQIQAADLVVGNTILNTGESIVVYFNALTGSDGECGLYTTNTFANSLAMVDYMEWGNAGHTRESVAVGAGVWNTGDFVPGVESFEFIGSSGDHGAAFWTSVIYGCTYPDADNYDPQATYDDGTCTGPSGSGCVGDLNNSLHVDTSDLLIFLGAFGNVCN